MTEPFVPKANDLINVKATTPVDLVTFSPWTFDYAYDRIKDDAASEGFEDMEGYEFPPGQVFEFKRDGESGDVDAQITPEEIEELRQNLVRGPKAGDIEMIYKLRCGECRLFFERNYLVEKSTVFFGTNSIKLRKIIHAYLCPECLIRDTQYRMLPLKTSKTMTMRYKPEDDTDAG